MRPTTWLLRIARTWTREGKAISNVALRNSALFSDYKHIDEVSDPRTLGRIVVDRRSRKISERVQIHSARASTRLDREEKGSMHAPTIRALGEPRVPPRRRPPPPPLRRDPASAASRRRRRRPRLVSREPRTRETRWVASLGARAPAVATRASSDEDGGAGAKTSLMGKADELLEKVGLSLGPIGMTLGESKSPSSASSAEDVADDASLMGKAGELMDKAGVSLGPIGMTLGESSPSSSAADPSADAPADAPCQSIANMTTEEWARSLSIPTADVDLFLEDEYNAASRLAGARECDSLTNVENIAWSGLPTDAISGVRHKVKVTDHATGECSSSTCGEPIRALRGGAGRMGTAQRLSYGVLHEVRGESHQGEARAAGGAWTRGGIAMRGTRCCACRRRCLTSSA